ncbi:MAG: murein biosynthesis integral membrane protein MurJ [Anaerolineales bacterium]
MNPPSSNRQIARAAGTVMFAILLGQATGLLRGILVARAFPPAELDAFFAANRVSETLFTLLAAGALGSAFIPTFTGLLAKGEKNAAWKLAASIANLLLLTLTLLAGLAALLAPQIVRYALAPGLATDPHLFPLTVELLRIQLISAVLFGLGGLIVGILNAHQIFFIPALTPSMYQLGMIFGVVVLAPHMGIYGLAWGVTLGAALYLLIQIPSLFQTAAIESLTSSQPQALPYQGDRRTGIQVFRITHYALRITHYLLRHYPLSLGLQDASVREVFRLMGPRVLGVAVVQLNFWVNTWLASQMAPGSVTGLQYGFSLMLMAQAAIAQSVAIAAMPTFSAQFALGKLDEMRASLSASLRGVLFLALPAAVGLILLREPVVSLLYQRGQFDARMTALVAWALLWYAAGMVGHSIMEVLTRAFYAQHDTRTPVLIGATAMGLNVIFSFAFSALFTRLGWMPHGGLALANSLATALEAAALFVTMRKRLDGINGTHLLRGLTLALGGTLALSAVLLLTLRFFSGRPAWLLAPGGILAGSLTYALTLAALHAPEVNTVKEAFLRRLARRS